MLVESIQSGDTSLDLAGIASNMHSILHFVSKENPRGPYPNNPATDGQYQYWEYGVQKWKNEKYAGLIPELNNEEEGETDENEDE